MTEAHPATTGPIDLDEVLARAERIRTSRPFKVDPVNTLVTEDVPRLVAELRAAREVVKAVNAHLAGAWDLASVERKVEAYDKAIRGDA